LFSFSSIQQYHDALKGGTVSCLDAVTHYLDRIERFTHLNAFVQVYGSEARQRASELDRQRASGRPMGRLHGVVIGIKDVICYQDHPVTAASAILQHFNSPYSATAVERLLQEEAIIIGHLNCDEFAMGSSSEHSVYGKVKNGLDESRVPGGSSGGSAVAVQAGLCMTSLGSDTGGSVRQPADFCGVIGFKPSYGRVSRYGLIAYASSFDQIGIFARHTGDVALVLETIAGKDPLDSTSSSRPVPAYSRELGALRGKLRIAVLKETLHHPSLDPEIRARILGFIEELREEGHEIREIDFDLLDYIVPAYYILTTAEASSNLSRFDGVRYGRRAPGEGWSLEHFYRKNRSEGFGKEVKRRILLGTFVLSAGYYDAYFTQAQKVRKILASKTTLIFNEFDIIISPTAPTTAFPSGEKSGDPVSMYLADIYTVYANLAGIPGISIPIFRHTNGMPFGIQAMTNRFQELSLLMLAAHLMERHQSFETPINP
jgi:aspartyl-tRNA(Asn)/glutamyl-tRNA(Gln) amidotransferase subunit A